MPIDAGTGKRRGFGFVEFEEADDAAEARDNMNSIHSFQSVLMIRRRIVRKGYSSWLFQADEGSVDFVQA